MGLQSVSSVCGLADSRVEGVVNGVEHVPHVVGTLAECAVDFTSQAFRRRAFSLGAGDVLLCISSPGFWDCDTERSKR